MKKILAFYHRKKLVNKNFSILSNNCWGGVVYDKFGMQYLTPTIGLWFMSEDYIKFISNPKYYLGLELVQINYTEFNGKKLLEQRKSNGLYTQQLEDFIIGRLDDVDIVFLHYKSFEDAKDKWNRRKERINWDNLIVKFNDQNGFRKELYEKFYDLPYSNKMFFTADKLLVDGKVSYYIDGPIKENGLSDDTDLSRMPLAVEDMINEMIGEKCK